MKKKMLIGLMVSLFMMGYTLNTTHAMSEPTYTTAVTNVGDDDRNDMNARRNDINYTRTAANNGYDNRNRMDYGWIGLLGLIGLAGLKRKNENEAR